MKVVVEDEASYNKWINQQTGLFAKKENNEGDDDESPTPESEILAIN